MDNQIGDPQVQKVLDNFNRNDQRNKGKKSYPDKPGGDDYYRNYEDNYKENYDYGDDDERRNQKAKDNKALKDQIEANRKLKNKNDFDNKKYNDELRKQGHKYAKQNIPCSSCGNTCVTLCFQSNNQQCTCNMLDGLFWLRKNKTSFQTYCEYLLFIDFSEINDVTMLVPSSGTYESTLEVWFFAYSYNLNTFNFKSMTIAWNLHNKIVVYTKPGNQLWA